MSKQIRAHKGLRGIKIELQCMIPSLNKYGLSQAALPSVLVILALT